MPSLEARLVKAELHLLPVIVRRDDGTFDRIRDSCMSSPLTARGTKRVEPCELLLDVLLEGGFSWPVAEFKTRFPRTTSVLDSALAEAGMQWADMPVRKQPRGPLVFDAAAARARFKAKQSAREKHERGMTWKSIIAVLRRQVSSTRRLA